MTSPAMRTHRFSTVEMHDTPRARRAVHTREALICSHGGRRVLWLGNGSGRGRQQPRQFQAFEHASHDAVCTENLNPQIMVMESAKDRVGFD